MAAFTIGFVMDLLFGDPYWLPHPIRWIGRLIGWLDRKLLGETDGAVRDEAAERKKGRWLVAFVLLLVFFFAAAVLFAVAKLGEMWAGVTSSQQMRTKKIFPIGMMSALAFILQIFDFPVPFAPPFYKLDFSEVPVLICSFAMGPVAGVASELLKNVLKVLFRGTTTAFVGDYANFVIGCSFIIPAAILYFKHKTKKTAIIGCVAGTIIIAIFGSLFNAFYLLPAFSKLYGMPLESILEMGHAIFSGFEEFNILTFVALCVAPLNLLKGALVSVIVMLIYKPISRILHQV